MSDRVPPKVTALVLTFNSPESLRACLRAIDAQTTVPDEVLVLDNGSEPPATEALGDPGLAHLPAVQIVRLAENTGPAGGHAQGLDRFLAGRSDYAWILDDDVVPGPKCLAALMAAMRGDGHDDVILLPRQHHADGHIGCYPAWMGVLMPRRVVEAIGLPRTDFFWWSEDTEYLSWRVREMGYGLACSTSATVVHLAAARSRHGVSRPPWKVYYEVRNTVYFRLWVQRGIRPRELLESLVKTLGRIAIEREDRGRKLWLYGRGVVDGLLARLGRRVPV